jgi:hypothetical protein
VNADRDELRRSIFREKIRRAQAIPAAGKIADAANLLDDTLALMRMAIATDNPTFGPAQIHAEVTRRLLIARRLDEAGIYRPAGTIDDEP